MSLEQFEEALKSYQGFNGLIGIIGGEPLMHPKFREMCELIRKYYPPTKMHLFTAIDPAKSKFRDIIPSTFYYIAYHAHDKEDEFSHQPLTIAIKDVVEDEKLKDELIDKCWLQEKWCCTITDDGAFFCEVGASIAKLMGRKGWDITSDPKWWMRTPDQFGDQLDMCQLCGMCVPMERPKMAVHEELISSSFLKLLVDNNLPIGEYKLFDRKITVEEMIKAIPTWTPGIYKPEQMQEVFQYCKVDLKKYLK
jgi:hypothetical protein